MNFVTLFHLSSKSWYLHGDGQSLSHRFEKLKFSLYLEMFRKQLC